MAKSSRYNRCIQQVKNASDGLSESELADLADELAAEAKRIKRARATASAKEAVTKALANNQNETVTKSALQKRHQYLMASTFAKTLSYITDTWRDDPRKGLEVAYVGSNIARRGAQLSIDAEQKGIAKQFVNAFASDLERTGKFDLYKSGDLDLDTHKALDELYKKNPNMTGIDRDARQFAEVIYKYQEATRVALNNAGAWIERSADYLTHQSHDMYKVRRALYQTTHSDRGFADRSLSGSAWRDFWNVNDDANFKAWRDFVRPLLDEEKTFKGVDEASNEEFLKKVWRNIASGDHLKSSNAATGFDIPKSLAKKLSSPRILHFKDGEARFKYAQMFGRGNTLMERTAVGLDYGGHAVGLMRRMGPNPDLQHERLKEAVKLAVEDTASARNITTWERDARMLDAYYGEISGHAHIPGQDPFSSFLRASRLIHVVSKLGAAMFSSFTDMSAIEGELKYQGIKGMANWQEQWNILTRGYGARGEVRADRLRQASELGVAVDMLRTGAFSRFSASDALPGYAAHLQTVFMKMNSLLWWTDMKRVGLAAATSHHLALLADRKFNALPKETLRLFKLFDIKEPEWDLMRDRAIGTIEGRPMFSPNAALKITDAEIASLLEAEGVKPTDTRMRERKEDILNKFRSLHAVRSSYGVMHAGAQAQVRLSGTAYGAKPGTVTNELFKTVGQFKSFPAAIIEKVYGRELYGYDESGSTLRGAWEATKQGGGAIGLAKFIAYSTFLGYISLQLKAYFAGRVLNAPRNDDDFRRQLAASFVQGGGMGIYGDFLMGHQKDRFGHSALADFAGPVASDAQDLYSLLLGSGEETPSGMDNAHREMKRGQAAAARWFFVTKSHLPFVNLWYTRMAFDYLIAFQLQEEFSPGSLARTEKMLRDDMGITYRLPPSTHYRPENLTGEDLRRLISPTGQ